MQLQPEKSCDRYHSFADCARLPDCGTVIPPIDNFVIGITALEKQTAVEVSHGNSCKFVNTQGDTAMTSNFQKVLRLSVIAAAGAAMMTSAAAGDVALVESLSTNSPGIAYMEYLKPGQVIRLGARDTVVLDYMTSCVQETIRGGTVTIGTELSEVQSGEVFRVKRECGNGKMVLTGDQTAIGGRTFRGAPH